MQTARDPRENLPDPESAPAVPIPTGLDAGVPGDRSSVASSEPFAPRASPLAYVASSVLPGAGHAINGEWLRGFKLVLAWGALLGLVFRAWDRITAIGAFSLDDFIAVAALALLLLTVWGWA